MAHADETPLSAAPPPGARPVTGFPTDPAEALALVRRAREVIAPHVVRTPTVLHHGLSRGTGKAVHLKLEMLQRTGAFKVRGALNKILTLEEAARGRGVIAASAGNHAQGVGLASEQVGVPATIVMPEATPVIKVERTKGYGAEVVLHGRHYEEAYEHAVGLAAERGLTMVHPFDDPAVIAGQGTIALELDEDLPEVDAVVVPIGGGGLISGIAGALAALRPGLPIIGVQAEDAAPMAKSFYAGRPVEVSMPRTIADGIQVGRVGELTFPLVQRWVTDIVTVSEAELTDAIVDGVESAKIVLEGAGAAALAALLAGKLDAYQRVCLCLCGGNIDLNRLERVIESGLAHAGRYHAVRLRTRDQPGTLARITELLSRRGTNILDIFHHRQGWKVPVGFVEVEILVETRGASEGPELDRELTDAGFEVL